MTKFYKNAKFLKKYIMNKISDFSRQCKHFQLEKPSGSKIEKPIQKKKIGNEFTQGYGKKDPPWV